MVLVVHPSQKFQGIRLGVKCFMGRISTVWRRGSVVVIGSGVRLEDRGLVFQVLIKAYVMLFP